MKFSGAVLLLLSTHAYAQTSVTAASGSPVKLYWAVSTNPDCSPEGRVVMRVTQAPQNGRITVRQAGVFPSYPSSNIRSACNRRRVPGVEVHYVSNRGYRGPDSASFEAIFPSGQFRQRTVSINVR